MRVHLSSFLLTRVWTFYCTLCGKSQHEVAQLIGGPSPVAPWTTQPAHGLPHHLLHAARRCRRLEAEDVRARPHRPRADAAEGAEESRPRAVLLRAPCR